MASQTIASHIGNRIEAWTRGGILALLWMVLHGCGSPPAQTPPPAAPPANAQAKPAAQGPGAAGAKAPAATQGSGGVAAPPQAAGDFTVDAEKKLSERLSARVSESELWKAYFAHRLSAPKAARPVVNLKASFERITDPVRPIESGGGSFKPGKVNMTLNVSDNATRQTLFDAQRTQRLPFSVMVRHGRRPQEVAFETAEDTLLKDTTAESAVAAMAAHADAVKVFQAPVAGALRDTGQSIVVRSACAEALSRMTPLPDDVLETLAELAFIKRDTNRQLSKACAEALFKTGPASLPALTQILNTERGEGRKSAVEVLARLGEPAAPALAEALRDTSWPNYLYVAEALGGMGAAAEKAVPALVENLKTSDALVRDASAAAIGKIGAGIPSLIAALESGDEKWQEGAAMALERAGPKAFPAVAALIQVLSSKDTSEPCKAAAIGALGKIGGDAKAALPALEAVAKGRNRFLAGRAASAAQKIKTLPAAHSPAPEVATPPAATTPAGTAAAKPETKAAPAAPAAPVGGEKPLPTYVLKDGRRIRAVQVVEADDAYTIKNDKGKFVTVPKQDVAEIIKE